VYLRMLVGGNQTYAVALRSEMPDRDGESVLRAKYRDYCSARVADALLSLSPEETFALAEARAREANRSAPNSHNDAIRLATGEIRDRLNLPEYESWATQYLKDPQRFDSYLMGLWKSEE